MPSGVLDNQQETQRESRIVIQSLVGIYRITDSILHSFFNRAARVGAKRPDIEVSVRPTV